MGELVEPGIKLSVIANDPEDDKIIECAVAARADYIVSGDKHLLSFPLISGQKIKNLIYLPKRA